LPGSRETALKGGLKWGGMEGSVEPLTTENRVGVASKRSGGLREFLPRVVCKPKHVDLELTILRRGR
jgi:hypothetical protein